MSTLGRNLAIAASVVIAAAVVAGIVVGGTPAQQREQRMDARRRDDLQAIDRLLAEWWEIHDALPADLTTLAKQPGLDLTLVDPVDGRRYGYVATGGDGFELCATFATDTGEQRPRRYFDDTWRHPRGRHCFVRKAERARD